MARLLVICFALSLAGCSEDSKPAPVKTADSPAPAPGKGKAMNME